MTVDGIPLEDWPLEGSVEFLTERDEDLFSTGEQWEAAAEDD